jgi:hypothetical protein
VAVQLAKSLEESSQQPEQRAAPKPRLFAVCSQYTKHGPAEPFYFLHIGPMSDVTVSRRLCVADFGHLMFMYGCALHLIFSLEHSLEGL